jgi:hypothetical protein
LTIFITSLSWGEACSNTLTCVCADGITAAATGDGKAEDITMPIPDALVTGGLPGWGFGAGLAAAPPDGADAGEAGAAAVLLGLKPALCFSF